MGPETLALWDEFRWPFTSWLYMSTVLIKIPPPLPLHVFPRINAKVKEKSYPLLCSPLLTFNINGACGLTSSSLVMGLSYWYWMIQNRVFWWPEEVLRPVTTVRYQVLVFFFLFITAFHTARQFGDSFWEETYDEGWKEWEFRCTDVGYRLHTHGWPEHTTHIVLRGDQGPPCKFWLVRSMW